MKKINLLLASLLTITVGMFIACSGNDAAKTAEAAADAAATEMTGAMLSGDMAVNAASSTVIWEGNMLGLYGHQGTIALNEGAVTLKDGAVTGGKFVVNMAGITPTDDGYNEENTKEKLVGHLSSPDFFDVANHPTASFEVTGAEGDKVMGNLTVRGITHPETVEGVSITATEGGAKVVGKLTFDRQKYDVKFSTGAKDKVLSDEIALNIALMVGK